MPRIDDHRKAAGENLEIFHLKPPFSFFDFIEDRFGDYDSIRRIFSLARSSLAKTLIIESIQPNGLISEENEDILRLFPSYSNDGLLRISFWNKEITEDSIADMLSEVLIGYAIFKRDVVREIILINGMFLKLFFLSTLISTIAFLDRKYTTLKLEVFHSKLKDCFTVNKMGLIKLALKWH